MHENATIYIEILLHEYDTLREEIMRRYDAQFQTIGIFAAIVVGLLATSGTFIAPRGTILLIICALVAFTGLYVWILRDIAKAANRLRVIEHTVNGYAEKHLLRWENDSKWGYSLRKSPKRQSD